MKTIDPASQESPLAPSSLKNDFQRRFSLNPAARRFRYIGGIFLLLFFPLVGLVRADVPSPGDPPTYDWLDNWTFNNTNTWTSEIGHAPVSFTNLEVSPLGNGSALFLDNTNGAWLQYNVFETNGVTNLTVNEGTLMFWFAPNWTGTNQGGNGPGQWGRLIEVGSYTTNASYGWWSIYLDPDGANIYFSSQTNGAGQTHLSAPIAWTTNRWHLIVLTYSPTNSALYLDGELATNGLPVTYLPDTNVLAAGFFVGSDNAGLSQARGIFDDISTYNFQLDAARISRTFSMGSFYYYLNPLNFANLSSAQSSPSYDPTFLAITGAGYLQWVGSNATSCVTSSNVWITNMVATLVGTNATNQSVNFTFEIAGGSNNLPYDVFATGDFIGSSLTNSQWLWMGQGYHCNIYTITNLPSRAFLILGTSLDSDSDGLTDAYERLMSHTNPLNPDTDGDGILDGWEVMSGLNPRVDESAQSSGRLNYTYGTDAWLRTISGKRIETIGLDSEANVSQATP